MKISVTQADIDAGTRRCFYDCPVALAAVRAFGGRCRVSPMRLEVPEGGRVVLLPHEAQVFINRFDFGRPVEPFEFEVLP